jgi:hypothetical protein
MASVGFQAFAEAFLNRTADEINKATDAAAKYRDELKEQAEKGKATMQRRKAVADQALGLVNQAKANGATDVMIDAALAAGPTGLTDLTANLAKIRQSMGSRWTPEAAQNAFELPEGFEGFEGTMEEKIRSTFGMQMSGLGTTEAPQRSFLQKMFGKDYREAVRADLDKEDYYNGASVMDLNELASQNEYQSLSGGTFMNFVMPKVFNPEDATSEVIAYNRIRDTAMETAKTSQGYADLKAKLEKAKAASVQPNTPEARAQAQEIARLTEELNDYVRSAGNTALEAYVRDRASVFTGGGYLESMGNTIDKTFGIEGVAAGIRNDIYGKPEDEAADPEAPVQPIKPEIVASQVEGAGGNVVMQPKGGMTVEHPSLKDISGTGSVTIETDEDNNPTGVTFDLDGEEVFSRDTRMIKHVMASVGRVRAAELGTIDVTTAGRDFTGVAPEDMPKIDPRMITDEEVDQLTRKQLRAAGLKESELGQFLMFLPEGEERDRQVEQITLKYNADPEAWYSVTVPGLNLNRPMKVKGSDMQYVPDAAIARGYNNIAFSEIAEGQELPKKTWTKSKIQRTYETFDPVAAKEEASSVDAATIAEEVDSATPGTPNDALSKTLENENDPTTQILKKHGMDIIKFLESEGFTQEDSEEEIAQGLTDWYANNSANLDLPSYPRDQGPMIYALKLLLKKD